MCELAAEFAWPRDELLQVLMVRVSIPFTEIAAFANNIQGFLLGLDIVPRLAGHLSREVDRVDAEAS